MRKDVILGMSIGGVMLAAVIFYLTLSSNGKHDKQGVEVAGQTDGNSGGSGDEPGQSGEANTGEYKPANTGGARSTDATPIAGKPTFLAATAVERTDPVWGKRLYADSVVTVTPDPSGPATGADTADKANAGEIPGGGKLTPPTPPTDVFEPPTTGPSTPNSGIHVDPPAPSPAKSHTHKVQTGETLSTIAAAAYGSPNLYPYILRANPKIDPNKLKVGTELTLPDASEVKGPEKAADKSAEKGSDAGTITHKIEPTLNAKTEYRVQAGDSLNKISVKLYGKVSMVQSIYDLNKSTIGDNPAKLKLGMVLKLPSAPTVN